MTKEDKTKRLFIVKILYGVIPPLSVSLALFTILLFSLPSNNLGRLPLWFTKGSGDVS